MPNNFCEFYIIRLLNHRIKPIIWNVAKMFDFDK